MNEHINLKELFQRTNKCYEVEIESKIEEIIAENEFLLVNLIDNKKYYKGLTIRKSEIFPMPTCNNLIKIKKINYRLNEEFQPRLFINAKIMGEKVSLNEKKISDSFDELNFFEKKIEETLQRFLDIKEKLTSNLFIVNFVNEKEYSVQLFKKKELFILDKKCEFLDYSLKSKDIIYINNYYVEDKNIKLTQISLIEKLSEEKLFILLQEKEEISNNYLWGKIIEKDEKNKKIRIMDKNTRLFTIENYNKGVKLGQFFIFSNYSIDGNIITLKEEKDDSFYYYSSQELYFSNKINLNFYSVIQFYFIDFNNNQNYYKKISVDKVITEIKSNKIEIIYNHSTPSINKLIPVEICLIKSESNKAFFFIKILQGLLNKISAFINYAGKPSYYFEYLCIYFKKPKNILEKTKLINCNNKNYIIKDFDNFNSNNRVRFNILNIPTQKDCEEYIKMNLDKPGSQKLSNSILVCESFFDDEKSDIYGIFDIKEIVTKIYFELPIEKIDYNSYYYTVGDIYDQIKDNQMKDNEVIEFLNNKENIFKLVDHYLYFGCLTFGIEITNSELKTRLGIIICFYVKMILDKKNYRKLLAFRYIENIIQKIELIKDKLTNSQLLRIFSYLLRAKLEYRIDSEILILSEEKNDSAYLLAQNYILEEIDNINEFSKLFQGYLQIGSYVLYNHKINSQSYSLSIEPLFIVKHHLKSNYEGFFILEEINDAILGWTEPRENFTIINEKYLLENCNYKDPSHISDKNELKNCAFGITIVLRHEDNSNIKNLNNNNIDSPLYYCEDGIAINITNNNPIIKKGKDGIIIESLITKDHSLIISLAKDFIYGDLLDYSLFVQKDFSELMEKIKKINKKNEVHNSNEKNLLNNNQIEMINKNEIGNIQNDYKNDEEQLRILAKKVVREGVLKIGDVFYPLDVIRNMVIYAENNNSTNQLYPIFIEVNKELEKIMNYNYK